MNHNNANARRRRRSGAGWNWCVVIERILAIIIILGVILPVILITSNRAATTTAAIIIDSTTTDATTTAAPTTAAPTTTSTTTASTTTDATTTAAPTTASTTTAAPTTASTTTAAPTTAAPTTASTTAAPTTTATTTAAPTTAAPTTAAPTTTATTTAAPTTASTTTASTTTAATLATSTSSTTPTTPATSVPGTFTIICPADLHENLEYNNASGIPTDYTILGSGCSELPINVVSSAPSIMHSKRKRVSFLKRSLGNIEMNVDMVDNCTMKEVSGPIQLYTAKEMYSMFNVSINVTYSNSKRDLFVYPNSHLAGGSSIWSNGGQNSENGNEIYASFEGNDLYRLSAQSVGGFFAAVFDAVNNTATEFLNLNEIFPNECANGDSVNLAIKIIYDHEDDKFLVAVLPSAAVFPSTRTPRICFAVSQTNNPSGSWWVYVLYNPAFIHVSGFDISKWGDSYTSCWQDKCIIMNRTAMNSGETPFVVILPSPLFEDPYPVVQPIHQGLSTRGDMITTHAPYGMFAILDDVTQSLKFARCTSIDFMNMTATLVFSSNLVSGGWISGVNSSCHSPTIGCIPTQSGQTIPAFPNYIRTAYYNYDSYEKFAYVFVNNSGIGQTNLVWGEMTDSNILLSDVTTTGSIFPVGPFSYYFAPGIAYDCQESLTIYFTQSHLFERLSLPQTYRLSTDPINTMRKVTVGTVTPNSVNIPTGKNTYGLPSVRSERNRKFSGVQADPLGGVSQGRWRILNQTITITYTATDNCDVMDQCVQTINLDALGPCVY